MNRFAGALSVLLVILGIWLCYLAFETVRWAAWTLLSHMGGIAALLACGVVFWFWRGLRKD
jgi:hypothetical protein